MSAGKTTSYFLPALLGLTLLAACATQQAIEHGEPPVQVVRTLSIEPASFGLSQRFVHCADNCSKPTPKTIGAPQSQAVKAAAARPAIAQVALAKVDTPVPLTDVKLTVRFAFGSAALSREARAVLEDALPALRQAQSVRLVGFTDSVGPSAANDYLAMARALAVRQELRRQLPKLSLDMETAGKGLCCYVASNTTDLGRAGNRRVEVFLKLSPESKAQRASVAQPEALARLGQPKTNSLKDPS